MTKICFACAVEKSTAEYHRHRGRKDGLSSVCKACANRRVTLYSKTEGAKAVRAKYFAEYKENEESRQKLQDYHREYQGNLTPDQHARYAEVRKKRQAATPRYALYCMLWSAAKRYPTENIATIDDLMEMFENQKGLCAVSGIVMRWGANRPGSGKKGSKRPDSISLDRIDGAKGYEKDNLRLVCWQVNLFKNCWTEGQMLTMARAIVAKADASDPDWNSFPGYMAESDHLRLN